MPGRSARQQLSDCHYSAQKLKVYNKDNPCMKPSSHHLNRRDFTKTTLLAGAAVGSGVLSAIAEDAKRIRTGVIGCGSVSNSYLPVLSKCSYVELVSLCDIRPERARKQADKFKVAHH